MKLFKKLMSAALLCVTATLSAQNCCPQQIDCDSSCNWFDDCEFSVFGEYLYWDLCAQNGDLRSVITNTDTPELRETVNFGAKYQSGYRVGGSLRSGCWEFIVKYASVNGSKNLEVNALDANLVFTQTSDFAVLDLQFGKEIYLRRLCGSLTPFIGIKLGWIDVTQTRAAPSNAFIQTGKSEFAAYGVSVGSNFYWQFWTECIPVAFVTRGSIALLKGSSTLAYRNTFSNGVLIEASAFSKVCALSFVPEIYVGLDFDLFCCDCFTANAQIGYEAQLWTSLTTLIMGGNQRELSTFGVNGLVLRLEAGF